jgi:hypothetical protein
MQWMIQNNVPGFTQEAVRTLERKNQGDLTLINEVAEAHFNPTDGQKLLQAGSSAVAQVPVANAFWGTGAAAGPVATNDPMPFMMNFWKEEREKDREHQKEMQADQNKFMLEVIDKMVVQPQPQAPPPAPKRQAEQAPAPGRHRQKLRAEYVPQPQGPSAAAEAPAAGGYNLGIKTAGRPYVLKLDPQNPEHQRIFAWLKLNLPELVSEVPLPAGAQKDEGVFLKLTDLQDALLSIPAFNRMVNGRRLGVEDIKRVLFISFPMANVGPWKAFHRCIGKKDEKGGAHAFHHYELNKEGLRRLQRMP